MSKIAPSILSADFANLGADVADVCNIGIDYLHIDVMDGTFVPNISFGPSVMKSLNSITKVPYDVHLMIQRPERFIEDFVTEHTEFITVHYEACQDPKKVIDQIHSFGIKAGISIKPGTDVDTIKDVLSFIDLVLVMSVEPGFGGQKFMPVALSKIEELIELRTANDYHYLVEVDGGVNMETVEDVKRSGAEILVAGSAVFKAKDRREAILALTR